MAIGLNRLLDPSLPRSPTRSGRGPSRPVIGRDPRPAARPSSNSLPSRHGPQRSAPKRPQSSSESYAGNTGAALEPGEIGGSTSRAARWPRPRNQDPGARRIQRQQPGPVYDLASLRLSATAPTSTPIQRSHETGWTGPAEQPPMSRPSSTLKRPRGHARADPPVDREPRVTGGASENAQRRTVENLIAVPGSRSMTWSPESFPSKSVLLARYQCQSVHS
jgi:hypothetical protein